MKSIGCIRCFGDMEVFSNIHCELYTRVTGLKFGEKIVIYDYFYSSLISNQTDKNWVSYEGFSCMTSYITKNCITHDICFPFPYKHLFNI